MIRTKTDSWRLWRTYCVPGATLGAVRITGHFNTHDLRRTEGCGRPREGHPGSLAPPPETAQAPGGHAHTAFRIITLAILEDTPKIFSMSEPCRSSLHFSSSSSLEAPQEEQVWLAGGIQSVSGTVVQNQGPTSRWPPFVTAPPTQPSHLPAPWVALVPWAWTPLQYLDIPPLLPGPWNHLSAQLRWAFCQLPSQRQTHPEGPPTAFPSELASGQFHRILSICEASLSSGPLVCPQRIMLTQ